MAPTSFDFIEPDVLVVTPNDGRFAIMAAALARVDPQAAPEMASTIRQATYQLHATRCRLVLIDADQFEDRWVDLCHLAARWQPTLRVIVVTDEGGTRPYMHCTRWTDLEVALRARLGSDRSRSSRPEDRTDKGTHL